MPPSPPPPLCASIFILYKNLSTSFSKLLYQIKPIFLFQEEQINPDPEGWVLEMLTDPNIKVVVVEDVDSTRTFDQAIFNKKSLEGSSLLDTSSET